MRSSFIWLAHVLFGKPVPTFPGHAPGERTTGKQRRYFDVVHRFGFPICARSSIFAWSDSPCHTATIRADKAWGAMIRVHSPAAQDFRRV
jgi:hypothetical protein